MIWKRKEPSDSTLRDEEKQDDIETRNLIFSMSNRLEELAEDVITKSNQLRREANGNSR